MEHPKYVSSHLACWPLLISLPSSIYAAAERRLQIGFVSIVPGIAPNAKLTLKLPG
jgi:hypothetical protein